jgi:hypothetical protein
MKPILILSAISVVCITAVPVDIVHITDVHIDPHYSQGSIANGCYCESYANCPLARSPSCVHTDDPSLAALMFGMPEDECATPPALWSSAMEYLSLANDANPAVFVVVTGDYGEAGLSYPCNTGQTAQEAIVENINNAMTAVRSAHPGLKVYGAFGNHVSPCIMFALTYLSIYLSIYTLTRTHSLTRSRMRSFTHFITLYFQDSAPGDVWDSSENMAWLLSPARTIFGSDFSNDSDALLTLLQGGFYSTLSPLPGLRIVSVNTNYWASTNPLLSNTSSEAYRLGQIQFTWLNNTLSAAVNASERVLIIGHHPPSAWISGTEYTYRSILTLFPPQTITAELFGHNHVDQFSIIRACTPSQNPSPNSTIQWIETDGINWCSGGNWDCGDIFHMGCSDNNCWCPLVPDFNGNVTARIEACKTVCGAEPTCKGFTWYPENAPFGACCMRTNTDQKPINSSSTAKCFEKPGGPTAACSGGPESPLHMLFVGPSLTEGYPPTNPALRRVRIDTVSLDVLDIITSYGNITKANEEWAFLWEKEYSFKEAYPTLSDMSADSFANLVVAMNASSSDEWDSYYTFNYKSYRGPSSLPCTGPCKSAEISFLNGSKEESY